MKQGKSAVLPTPASTAPSKSELLTYDQYQSMLGQLPPAHVHDPNRPETALTLSDLPYSAMGSVPPSPGLPFNYSSASVPLSHGSNGRMGIPGNTPVAYERKLKDPNEMSPMKQRAFAFRSAINKQTSRCPRRVRP